MPDDSQRVESVVQHLSRRRLLAGSGVGLVGVGGLVWASEPTHARVSVDALSIPDTSFESESVVPVVDLTLWYDYDAGTEAVSELVFVVKIGGDRVATTDLRTDRTTLSGETSVTARVTDSDSWRASDFAPSVGESVERDVTVTVRFEVQNSDGTALVSDTTSDDVTITVTHPQDNMLVAEVGGEGTVRTATPSE